jgi:hypothetical protein
MDKIANTLVLKVNLARTLLTKGSVYDAKLIEDIITLRQAIQIIHSFEVNLIDWNMDID